MIIFVSGELNIVLSLSASLGPHHTGEYARVLIFLVS